MKDGGPAFARPLGAINGEEWSSEQEGMSLRDYFAAQAMIAISMRMNTYRVHGTGNNDPGDIKKVIEVVSAWDDPVESGETQQIAKEAYNLADSMLIAREKSS